MIPIYADENDLIDIRSCNSHMTKLMLSEEPSESVRLVISVNL